MHAGPIPVEVARGGALGVGMQPALVGQRGDGGADRWMHPVRAVQEVAAFIGQRALTVNQPIQR